jgi:hypothetical protein
MNRLQRRAWVELVGVTAAVIIAGTGVGLAFHFNARGVIPIMSFVIGSLIAGLVSGLHSIAAQGKFDERERKIAVQAFIISSYTFVLFLCISCFTVFFLAGARNYIPGYSLPVLLLTGIFVSQLVQSAVILVQFAREQADEQ